jgi:hypothetical protein
MQNINNTELLGKKSHSSSKPRVVNFYVGMAVDIIFLYFFNNIVFVKIPFLVTNSFVSCLWAINLALAAGIIGNFVFLLYRPNWFVHLIQAVMNALVILAVYVVFKIFPLTFDSSGLETAARIILIVIMAATGIGFIVELVRAGIAFTRREPPDPPVPPISPISALPSEPPAPPPESPPSEPPSSPPQP